MTTEERFWSKVRITPGCWEWIGGRGDGYGCFWYRKKPGKAYRYSYEIHKGPIPPGLEIDHLCRNRACVNPDHLEAVTTVVNVMRGEGFSAKNKRKTRCPKGHEYTPENTIILKPLKRGGGPRRECATCRVVWARINNENYRKRHQA